MDLPDVRLVAYSICLGLGATAFMDAWSLLQRNLLKTPALDYGLVGRWLIHMTKGRFAHVSIAKAPAMKRERTIGWAAHYAIGIVFAGLFLALVGAHWAEQPTLLSAATFGLLTVAVPFFIMQPAFGLGVAAARVAAPVRARILSVIAHMTFGIGLFVAAKVMTWIRWA